MFIASDESVDRHGDSLSVDAWDLRNFKKAPRLLVDHDHRVEKIVGKAVGIKIEKAAKRSRLIFEAVIHDITELSRSVKEMIEKGFLNTVSVGFIPNEKEVKAQDGTVEKKQSNELVEISFVTVPANPNAQQLKSLMEKEEEVNAEKIKDFYQEKQKEHKEIIVTASTNEQYKLVFEGDEVKDITNLKKDEVVETERKATAQPKREHQGKGRSLSSSERRAIIMRRGLKQAVRELNLALNQSKKVKN